MPRVRGLKLVALGCRQQRCLGAIGEAVIGFQQQKVKNRGCWSPENLWFCFISPYRKAMPPARPRKSDYYEFFASAICFKIMATAILRSGRQPSAT